MNIHVFGALFILSLSIDIMNSPCKEGAKYVDVYLRTTISFNLYKPGYRASCAWPTL